MALELLAPAGNMEKMKTALAFGADAVYAGIPDFSLRVRINDFDLKKLNEAKKYCQKANKKLYVTVNIFAHNRHLEEVKSYIKLLKKIKVDALIVSDPGLIVLINEIWPEAEIHLSTQANCTNYLAAKFWHSQGVKRIVLGREVTLAEIKEIHKQVPDLELEYFIHGAMCMTYSGRCFLSKMYLDRSANLGDCVQPCRWEFENLRFKNSDFRSENSCCEGPVEGEVSYKSVFVKAKGHDEVLEVVEEEHGSYILNSKDLCLISHLRDLVEAGVTSFKIEGRAKSVYYQAMVNGIYSFALRNINTIDDEHLVKLEKELETKLVHRGYTKGFLLGGKADQNLDNSHVACDWEFCGQAQKISDFRFQISDLVDLDKKILVKVHNAIFLGDEIEIVRPPYDVLRMKVLDMIDARSGESISEAHGGQDFHVLIAVPEEVPEYSVIRRLITK